MYVRYNLSTRKNTINFLTYEQLNEDKEQFLISLFDYTNTMLTISQLYQKIWSYSQDYPTGYKSQ